MGVTPDAPPSPLVRPVAPVLLRLCDMAELALQWCSCVIVDLEEFVRGIRAGEWRVSANVDRVFIVARIIAIGAVFALLMCCAPFRSFVFALIGHAWLLAGTAMHLLAFMATAARDGCEAMGARVLEAAAGPA